MADVVSKDVIIVGGGLVGLSLAALLGRAGFGVGLIEARPEPGPWPGGSVDLRVFAISRSSQQLLADAGAWADILPHACPYSDMRVWDAGGSGDIHFDSAELGEANLGHIIESRIIERALLGVLSGLDHVTQFRPAEVDSFSSDAATQTVNLNTEQVIMAPLLVGADGPNSRVRDAAGIHARVSDYGQQALVAVVECERGHDNTAWQRFLPGGPLAFLPLRDGRCSIVWSAAREQADRLMALDDSAFCQTLGEAIEERLGKVLRVGERALFPLHRQYAEHAVKPGVALAGDALHVIHPLAGQGVNLGLKDVRALTDVLMDARGRGRSPGRLAVLRRYERARKGDNMTTMLTMDGFKYLFASSVPPVRWLRNTGLNLVDSATPLKNVIMRTAMGL